MISSSPTVGMGKSWRISYSPLRATTRAFCTSGMVNSATEAFADSSVVVVESFVTSLIAFKRGLSVELDFVLILRRRVRTVFHEFLPTRECLGCVSAMISPWTACFILNEAGFPISGFLDANMSYLSSPGKRSGLTLLMMQGSWLFINSLRLPDHSRLSGGDVILPNGHREPSTVRSGPI